MAATALGDERGRHEEEDHEANGWLYRPFRREDPDRDTERTDKGDRGPDNDVLT